MRLLVVDDNAKLRRLLVGRFTRAGYGVDAVGTVAAARLATQARRYDLVLLELLLPDGDGEAVVRHLRARGYAMPVLVGTKVSDLDRRIAALEAGADDFLVKPYASAELLARVRALLRRPPGILRSDAAATARGRARPPVQILPSALNHR
jgi:DNA-binding response OmpR family regulator